MTHWFILFVCGIILLACFFLLVMLIDGNRFKVVTYELTSEKVKRSHRFVLLADLHDKSFGKENASLLESIDELRPEAVFMAGDMMTAKGSCSYDHALELMRKLSEKYPVFYGMGNHESRLYSRPESYKGGAADYERRLKKLGIGMLQNEGRVLGDEFAVMGLELDWDYYRHFKIPPMEKEYLEETLGPASKEKYQILLAHNPDYFENYAQWGADLVLSGHVHGGIMRLPLLGGVVSPTLLLFPKYDGGLFKKGSSAMILSRGLGTHTLPIRIFNPGELILFTISPKRNLAKNKEN